MYIYLRAEPTVLNFIIAADIIALMQVRQKALPADYWSHVWSSNDGWSIAHCARGLNYCQVAWVQSSAS